MLRLAARDVADPVTVVTDPRLRNGYLGNRFLSNRMAIGADFIASTAAAAPITDRRSGVYPAAGAIAIISRAAATRRPHRLVGHPGEW